MFKYFIQLNFVFNSTEHQNVDLIEIFVAHLKVIDTLFIRNADAYIQLPHWQVSCISGDT